jgi:hypothetical protein
MARLEAHPIYVEWKDAHGVAHGWTALDDIESDPAIIHSIGYHLPDLKPGHYCIGQSLDDSGNVDSVLCIPVEMVLRIVTIGNPPLPR